MTVLQSHGPYRFGSPQGLTTAQIETLIACFEEIPQSVDGILEGRIQAQRVSLSAIARVVVKHYFRGGILRHLNRRTYLRIGNPRSRAEYEWLAYLPEIGVNAPEPVAYAVKGRILYNAWLVTKELPDVASLSQISQISANQARNAMHEVVRQVERLIQNRIHHVDLHPGNILVSPSGRVYFIDFDKACRGRRNKKRLRRQYVHRWARAVEKYELPRFIEEMFTLKISG